MAILTKLTSYLQQSSAFPLNSLDCAKQMQHTCREMYIIRHNGAGFGTIIWDLPKPKDQYNDTSLKVHF